MSPNIGNFACSIKQVKMSKDTVEDRISTIEPKGKTLNVLSFFSGAMGLDIGLRNCNMNILLACEFNNACRQTIIANEPQIGLIGDIRKYSTNQVLEYANVTNKEQVDIIVGGPPCQAFSTAGKRLGLADERGNVFLKFIDIITDIRPKYAVIENVRGLLSSKMTIDVDDEIVKAMPFNPKTTSGSTLYYITKKLEKAGYNVTFNLYNSANFGVPQIRERVVIICTLEQRPVPFLSPTHSKDSSYNLPNWISFGDAIKDLDCKDHHYIELSSKTKKYISLLESGQYWKNLPKDIQEEAMGASFHLQGGKTGFYRRLSWDKPAPTLVTHPSMPATLLAHPIELRPLSVEEYKRIQQFPDNWILKGKILDQYKQLGNAVPVGLGTAIGNTIIAHHNMMPSFSPKNFKYSRYLRTSNTDFFKALLTSPNQPELELF